MKSTLDATEQRGLQSLPNPVRDHVFFARLVGATEDARRRHVPLLLRRSDRDGRGLGIIDHPKPARVGGEDGVDRVAGGLVGVGHEVAVDVQRCRCAGVPEPGWTTLMSAPEAMSVEA